MTFDDFQRTIVAAFPDHDFRFQQVDSFLHGYGFEATCEHCTIKAHPRRSQGPWSIEVRGSPGAFGASLSAAIVAQVAQLTRYVDHAKAMGFMS